MARDDCPDLILMDLTMPLIDGLQAMRILEADCPPYGSPSSPLPRTVSPRTAGGARRGCLSFLAKPV
jgi:CheY-like chemotaxis protein